MENDQVTPAERWNFFETECRRVLDVPASDFLQRLEAGYYHNPAMPFALRQKAEYLRQLLPYTDTKRIP